MKVILATLAMPVLRVTHQHENTVFVSELEKAGVTFIGPNSNAIKDMGDKIASKS